MFGSRPAIVTWVVSSVVGFLPDLKGRGIRLVPPVNSGPLVEYARDKFNRRLEIIADADAELPDVEELVDIEGAEASS